MGEVEVVPLTSDAKKSPGWGHVEISRGMCMQCLPMYETDTSITF